MCKISLITLCYNQLENATKPMLESLYKFSDLQIFELIIVNNGSTDGTKEFLDEFSSKQKNAKVIHNKENFGFAKGMNEGLKAAKGDFIFLLNNDLLFTQNWLEKLTQILENNPDIGLLSCKTNYCGEDFQLVENADELTAKNYLEKIEISDKNRFDIIEATRIVFFCVGLSRKSFEKIGFLDENFGLAWYEDDDYTLRTLYAGLKIAIAQDVFIYHNHSQSTSKLSQSKEGKELFEKNRNYFENKHYLYKILKTQAEKNNNKDFAKIKSKLVKYRKLFNILLPTVIIEFLIILAKLVFLLK